MHSFKPTPFLSKLPTVLKQEVSKFLDPKDLSSAMLVNNALAREIKDDSYWKVHASQLGKLTKSVSFFTQFKDKNAIVKQKAALLAQTFLEGPPEFTGEFIPLGFFGGVKQEFLDFAIPHLKKHVFNDLEFIDPLAIIQHAILYFNLKHTSFSPKDGDQTTLIHALPYFDKLILEKYLVLYGTELDINSERADDSTALTFAILPSLFLEEEVRPSPDHIVLLLEHNANIPTDIEEIIAEIPSIPLKEDLRERLCRAIKNGLDVEKVKKIFPADFAQYEKTYFQLRM